MTIDIQGKSYSAPDSWNQLLARSLTLAQKVYLAIMIDTKGMFAPIEEAFYIRLSITNEILNWPDGLLQEWQQDCINVHGKKEGEKIFLDELNVVVNAVSDPYLERRQSEEGPDTHHIKLELTDPPYPSISYKSKLSKKLLKYYAAGAGMDNVTFYEIVQVFSLFDQWQETGDLTDQVRLLSTVFREPKAKTKDNILAGFDGDIRRPLLKHESRVDVRMKNIQTMAEINRNFLTFWISSCRADYIRNYPLIFRPAGGSDKEANYADLLLSLSPELAHLDKTSATAAHTVFTLLTKNKREADERLLNSPLG